MVIKMKFFFTFTKKGIAVFLAIIIIGFICASRILSVKYSFIDGSTEEKRIEYIRKIGHEADEKGISSKEILIPAKFTDVYREYNRLQKQSGFDLAQYKGRKATVYSYPLCGSEKILNLIVYKGEIIGGDICSPSFNGEMKPLPHKK